MAKPSLLTFNPTDGVSTFQTLFNKVNEIVTLFQNDVMTASAGGDSTTGNATLIGNFTANIITGNTSLRTETIGSRNTTNTIRVISPVNINSGGQTPIVIQSALGPRESFTNGSTTWYVGFESDTVTNFVIGNGGSPQFRFLSTGEMRGASLTLTGNASMANITATGGTLNNVVIGGTTAAAGTFTSITATSGTLNNVVIGGTTAAAGTFTTLIGTTIRTGNGTVTAPAFAANADTNTGIFFPAADTMAFALGGAEQVRVLSTGFVGLGILIPTQKLHVENGNIFLGSATTGANYSLEIGSGNTNRTRITRNSAGTAELRNQGGNLSVISEGANSILFSTNALERMRIDNNGGVGIGGTAVASAILALTSTTRGFLPPRMTTTERNAIASPANGLTVYNTTLGRMEIYSSIAANWVAVGAGATGGGNDQIFWENDQVVTNNYTITNGKNAGSFGPITIADGATVTVGDGEVWTII